MWPFGQKKTWDELCREYDEALSAGQYGRAHSVLKRKIRIAERENNMMKKLVCNSEWLSLKERLGMG